MRLASQLRDVTRLHAHVALPALAALALIVTSCSDAPTVSPRQVAGPVEYLLLSGDGQSGAPGEELPDPLVVQVTDARGHRVRGQIINFRVIQGGGSVFAGVALTNSNGIARERWTLGMSGAQRVEARAIDDETGAAVTFGVFTATVIDNMAPDVFVRFTVNPVAVGRSTRVMASVIDIGHGDTRIAGAEYRVDDGAFAAMTPLDALDSPAESLYVDLPGFNAAGMHQICARGSDAAGNTSAPSCAQLEVFQPLPAQLTIAPTSKDFGNVNVGTFASWTFVVRNTGGLPSGAISAALAGANASDYSIIGNTCAPLTALPPDTTCQISVKFTPSTAGSRVATLSASATPGGSASATLTGQGYTLPGQPALVVSPTTWDFGTLAVGGLSVAKTFQVTNTGGSPTSLMNVALEGTNPTSFGIATNTCAGTALAGGATCYVGVSFRPMTDGPLTASLAVSAATGGVARATLTGTGTLAGSGLTVSPTSKDYGSVVIGQSSTQIFTLQNVGTQPLASLTWVLTGPGDFQIISSGSAPCASGMTLYPGQSCTLGGLFLPTTPGSVSATVDFWSGATKRATVQLTGTGTSP